MQRHPHILNAASNLLGICFIIITGLKLTNSNARSLADETAWVAAVLLLASCFLAYFSINPATERRWFHLVAEMAFLLGMTCLFCAVVLAALIF